MVHLLVAAFLWEEAEEVPSTPCIAWIRTSEAVALAMQPTVLQWLVWQPSKEKNFLLKSQEHHITHHLWLRRNSLPDLSTWKVTL
ncbi:hypothetical protein Y1Q_0005610 [Alligator mississippiensis]|uniref:Secreted protein n=1 Tax=Alligator mississippiensis TaxID=8496 RepID=A0A151MFA5_ALLMI|nr:hypothetical protein Y1Q_0005610 [Alligator mississippiensis]